jgi:hypothetical protein
VPVKQRSAKERRYGLSPEALSLFAELEATPLQCQYREDYREREHELARLMGLVSEFWTGNSVLDRSAGPCHPPEYIAHEDWHRCRAVREQLLALLREGNA